MLHKKLENFRLILGSGSPRRQKFLEEMRLPFVKILKPVEEIYPPELQRSEITDFLVRLKAEPFKNTLKKNDILLTCDTIVWHEGKALGKPKNDTEAINMLKSLSGKTHEVITSICFTTISKQRIVNASTLVEFRELNNYEIEHYVTQYKPLDKAGSYGIQEWIGRIGITKIEGSYENVVGLPTQVFYDSLGKFITE